MRLTLAIFALIFSSHVFAQIPTDNFKVGDRAPSINGIDQFGNKIKSKKILQDQKILLIFYRGNWCPHCRKHLSSLQEHLEAFTEKGVYVIVVTPETSEKIEETEKKLKTGFSTIHDVNNKIMNKYKVAFEVNKDNIGANYFNVLLKTAEYNDANNNVLPVPATYLIDQNGEFIYVHYDPDYKNRSDFGEVFKLLE